MKMSLKTMALLIVLLAVDMAALVHAGRSLTLGRLLFFGLPALNAIVIVAVRRPYSSLTLLVAAGATWAIYVWASFWFTLYVAGYLTRVLKRTGLWTLQSLLFGVLRPLTPDASQTAGTIVDWIMIALISVFVSTLLLIPALLAQAAYELTRSWTRRRTRTTAPSGPSHS